MEERRKFVRVKARFDMTYAVMPDGAAHQAVTQNVSGGGLSFLAPETLVVGAHLRIVIPSPATAPQSGASRLSGREVASGDVAGGGMITLPGGMSPIAFTAEVLRSEPFELVSKTGRQQGAEITIRFLDVASQDREVLMQHALLNVQSHPSS